MWHEKQPGAAVAGKVHKLYLKEKIYFLLLFSRCITVWLVIQVQCMACHFLRAAVICFLHPKIAPSDCGDLKQVQK
jgi:hypothetical protein